MVILEFTAVVFAIRQSRNWYHYHRLCALSGAVLGAIGVAELFIVKQLSGETHFEPLHAKLGAVAIVLLTAVALVGINLSKLPPAARTVHRIAGRITLPLLIIVLIMGLMLVL